MEDKFSTKAPAIEMFYEKMVPIRCAIEFCICARR